MFCRLSRPQVWRLKLKRSRAHPDMPTTRVRAHLIRRLQAARLSVVDWDGTLLAIAGSSAADIATAEEIRTTHELLAQARIGLERRLASLGADVAPRGGVKPRIVRKTVSRAPLATVAWRMCIDACRACGRVLSAAYRAAQRFADGPSANVLYNALRDLEKQLWVLTPHHA